MKYELELRGHRYWAVVTEAPCDWCYIEEPHRHSLNPDGTLGIWVEFMVALL